MLQACKGRSVQLLAARAASPADIAEPLRTAPPYLWRSQWRIPALLEIYHVTQPDYILFSLGILLKRGRQGRGHDTTSLFSA